MAKQTGKEFAHNDGAARASRGDSPRSYPDGNTRSGNEGYYHTKGQTDKTSSPPPRAISGARDAYNKGWDSRKK